MILYKYLKKEHLLKFKVDGSILVNTLYNLRKVEHQPIRDEAEGRQNIKISSSKQPMGFSGKEFHKLIPVLKMNKKQEKNITVDIEDGAQFNMEIANAFVFCTSLKLDESLFKKFSYDAYYKITNPVDFAYILYEKLNQVVTIRCFKADKVKYANKPIILTSSSKAKVLSENQYWDIGFTKLREFSEDREFRMVFVPEFARKIEPRVLKCPELRKCCAF